MAFAGAQGALHRFVHFQFHLNFNPRTSGEPGMLRGSAHVIVPHSPGASVATLNRKKKFVSTKCWHFPLMLRTVFRTSAENHSGRIDHRVILDKRDQFVVTVKEGVAAAVVDHGHSEVQVKGVLALRASSIVKSVGRLSRLGQPGPGIMLNVCRNELERMD